MSTRTTSTASRNPAQRVARGEPLMDKISVLTGTAVPLAARQRRHRPDHPCGVSEAGDEDRLRRRAVLRVAPGSRFRAQPGPSTLTAESSSPDQISAPARAASTPSGHCATSVSRPCSARSSATSSAATRASRGCSPARSASRMSRRSGRSSTPQPGIQISVDLNARTATIGDLTVRLRDR